MNNLDYAILIGIGLFTGLGFYWGLIRQVLAIVGLVVGVAAAGRYGPDVGIWLSSFVTDPLVAGLLGFLGVFCLVSATASLIASILRFFAGLLFLGLFDHLLGGLLGLLQAVLAAAVLLIALVTFPLPAWASTVTESLLAAPFLRVGGIFSGMLPEIFGAAMRAALGGG